MDLDKYAFQYSYRLLPNIALDKSYLSYAVEIAKAKELGLLASQSDTSRISISGRKKVPSHAHFTVHINLDKIIFGAPEVKERVEVIKDKEGKETGRRTLYRVEVRYSFEATAVVKDYKDVELSKYKTSSRDKAKVYKTDEYSTGKYATKAFNSRKDEISGKLISEEINLAYTFFNTCLNKDFGISIQNPRSHLQVLGSSKHPEYQAWKDACVTGKSVLETINADSIPGSASFRIKSAIDYFTSVETNFRNPEEKAEKKLRYGAYFNLATIYLCLEQFDKAKEYAQKLIENDFDVKDGNELMQEANTIISRLDKHQMTTQHFKSELSNISLPQ